jgi:hypothetical protein
MTTRQVSLLRVAAFSGVALLSACSDQKSANENNFVAAINAYFADKPVCLPAVQYPAEIVVGAFGEGRLRAFDALVGAGLLNREELRRPAANLGEQRDGPEVHTIRYMLADKGRKSLSDRGWCYGVRKVVKIVRFTEPTDAFGARVSEVLYAYSYAGVPDWAKNNAVIAAFPQLQEVSAAEPPQERVVLVLTNQGWQVGP